MKYIYVEYSDGYGRDTILGVEADSPEEAIKILKQNNRYYHEGIIYTLEEFWEDYKLSIRNNT
jgi:hypothetical protein